MTYLQILSKVDTSLNLMITIEIEDDRMREEKDTLNIYPFILEIREPIISQRIF